MFEGHTDRIIWGYLECEVTWNVGELGKRGNLEQTFLMAPYSEMDTVRNT